MNKRVLIFLVIAGLSVIAVTVGLLQSRESSWQPPEAIQKVFEAQQNLPPEEVQAIQDLRLMAGVQAAHFSQNGSYASPEGLKGGGLLDPEWPRASRDSYQATCTVLQERLGFECYADPIQPEFNNYYFVDASQIVRTERNRRPDENSPAFGTTKETR